MSERKYRPADFAHIPADGETCADCNVRPSVDGTLGYCHVCYALYIEACRKYLLGLGPSPLAESAPVAPRGSEER